MAERQSPKLPQRSYHLQVIGQSQLAVTKWRIGALQEEDTSKAALNRVFVNITIFLSVSIVGAVQCTVHSIQLVQVL